jgi:hypothetical protein
MPVPKKETAYVSIEVARAALRTRMQDKDAKEAYIKSLEKLSPEARRFALKEAGIHNYSSAPHPIALGIRTIAPPAELPPIDWNHWKIMLEVPLWKAVALSVNINPETLRKDPAILAFDKRADIALSHVSAGKLDVVKRLTETLKSPVLLASFAAWAVGLGFHDVPPEFVAIATASLGKSNNDTLAVVTPVANASASEPTVETPELRRARWMDMYGNGERGAVQRVYKAEQLKNPKADRSYIGKEIKKAKAEKAKATYSTAMFRQLVRDGKRTP